jgi:hypothetical protein
MGFRRQMDHGIAIMQRRCHVDRRADIAAYDRQVARVSDGRQTPKIGRV